MKTTFFSCLALASSFALAAPALESTLVDRAPESPYYAPSTAILTNLYSEIKQYTAAMNATSATLKPNTPGQDTPAVNAVYESNIASINTAITGATADVRSTLAKPAPAKRALASRQVSLSLENVLATIVAEIGGTLSMIVAALGLPTVLSLLSPLVSVLNALVGALLPVVGDLVMVVGSLLNGVLGGLGSVLVALLNLL